MTTPTCYAIVIKDQLDGDWNDWFAGMRLHYNEHGETILEGPVVDQAALHGLINNVFMLGLTLIGVVRLPTTVYENAKESLASYIAIRDA